MSSPQTTDSSLPNDQPSDAPEAVSKADFEKLQGNYHAAQRQISKLRDSQVKPDDLVNDADFVKRVFETHNVPFDEEGKFKLPDGYKDAQAFQNDLKQSLKDAETKWEAKKYRPLEESYQKLESKYQQERRQNLIGRIDKAARDAEIVAGKFKPVNPLDKSSLAAVHAAANSFKEHPETGDWVLFNGDEPVYSSTGDVITPEAYWAYFKDTAPADVQLDWFGNPAQRGSGYSHNGRATGEFVMTREQARSDFSKFKAMQEQAAKVGKQVRVLD